ncbi:glucose 1-dehydrogenase [Goodfellowiella coeruleoviolacea]|uniref:Threonine dehydrogenase n=1 Tax=Goodfellowiella coeruleoviolacea TaxID=334858 RepID=A0AAE3GDC8_9PSEU|nr:glucose 1-dehydrogenase [Goodfellowiella coeruleoviolacea]MCP2166141.1 Threonine dehydrogenase [Goodfellowiella coeruleoviolacea]
MRAATVVPGRPELADVTDLAEPVAAPGELLVDGLLVGACGTDVEIVKEGFGELPPGRDRMVLFHESLGRVRSAPAGSGFVAGDLVAGVVRRPDPEPCAACAADQWDFCRNGRYTERGIKELDGYGAQRWTIEPKYAIRIDPALGELGVLTEPASTVAKAWEQAELVGRRGYFAPRTALVTGAGSMGLLAALFGVQRGLAVHVLDRVSTGPKPDLVRMLGASYHQDLDTVPEPDVVIECTGAASLVFDLLRRTARNSVTVLIGLSGSTANLPVPAGVINDRTVLANNAVVGCVNGSLANYRQGSQALAAADPRWLRQLITRRVPLADWPDSLRREPDDVKVVVDLT